MVGESMWINGLIICHDYQSASLRLRGRSMGYSPCEVENGGRKFSLPIMYMRSKGIVKQGRSGAESVSKSGRVSAVLGLWSH